MKRETNSGATDSPTDLTTEELQTLRYSVEHGYFEVPRETTLVDIAAALDRSDVEVSRQLRRGLSVVLRECDAIPSPEVEPDGGADPNALDRAFDALRHPYRRHILTLVAERNPRGVADVVSKHLATEDDDPERLTTELYHAHLPKLADSGYIEWDEDTHTVRRGPNFDEIAPLLRLLDDHEDELPGGWP